MTLNRLIELLQEIRSSRKGDGDIDIVVDVDTSDQYAQQHMERPITWVTDVAGSIQINC